MVILLEIGNFFVEVDVRFVGNNIFFLCLKLVK